MNAILFLARTGLAIQLLAAASLGQPPTGSQRPQTPQPPFPYESHEISLESGDTRLAGTLTLPARPERTPAVVLVPGAGAVDRDDTIFGHKPFLVLADHLARHGVASLRLDSRGIGQSTGNYSQASGETLAGDVLAAVEFLTRRPEVRPGLVGIVGHSQGGMVAALAATKSSRVAFLVLLGAPGLPDTELIALRVGMGGRNRKIGEEEISRVQGAFRAARLRQAKGEDDSSIRTAFAAAARLLLPAGVDLPAAVLEDVVGQQIAAAKTPNAAYFMVHDARESYRRVRCPVLALNGSLDQNVPARENLAELEGSFRQGKNASAEIVEVQGLNHFFQTARTGSSTEVGQIEETFSPKALDLLTTWVLAREAGAHK